MTGILLAGATIGSQLDALFYNFDYSIFTFLGNVQNSFFTALAKFFTTLGDPTFVVLLAVLGLILCFFPRTRKVGFAIVFSVIIGTLIVNVIAKPLVMRVRPYNTLQADAEYFSWYIGAGRLSESDFSFPSGHTTGSVEICMALLLVHATSKRKGAKKSAWIFPVLAILVAVSRAYLMVHYATDVIAGFVIGSLAGVAGFFLAKLACKIFAKHDEKILAREPRKGLKVAGTLAVVMAVVVCFAIALVEMITFDSEGVLRCAYDDTYDCQNEARTSSKYPAIDGEYYCKIHWNELMDED